MTVGRSSAPGLGDLANLTASDLMSADVLTVGEELTVQQLAAFLAENQISGAPVENPAGELVGVVSVFDVARAASLEPALELAASDYYGRPPAERGATVRSAERPDHLLLRVADIMTPKVFSVGEDASVEEVAKLMLHAHLHRVLVMRRKKLVGIVSSSDLIGLLVGE